MSLEIKQKKEKKTVVVFAFMRALFLSRKWLPVPGLAVSQATHLVTSALFCTMQASHSHVPAAGANLANKPSLDALAGATDEAGEQNEKRN
jgi:hypothetical protein